MGTELSNLQEPLKIGTVSAGAYTEIEEDGTPVQRGDATVWEDQRFPLVGQGIDTTSGRLGYNYFNGAVFFAGKYGVEWSSDNLESDEIKEMLDYQGKIAKLKKEIKKDELS